VHLEVLRHAPVEARHLADRELAVARARHALEVALALQPLLQLVELAHLRAYGSLRVPERKIAPRKSASAGPHCEIVPCTS
jgi:hypothetical protein